MLKFQSLRLFWSSIVVGLIAVIAIVAMIASANSAVGVVIFLLLLAGFYLQGLAEIPADPPRRAIPEFWGAFIDADNGGTSLPPGRTFFPLLGILFDYVLFDAGQINLEMSIQERTPDNGNLTVDPFFTYMVNPEHPTWFIKAGDKAGVELKFTERVDGRLREWIASSNEGPLTWQEARQSNGLAVGVIIDKLFPGRLPTIPDSIRRAITGGDEIPTSAFIKYFTGRPALSEANPHETGVKAKLDALKAANRAEWNLLQTTVRSRIAFTENVKGGGFPDGFPIDNLGIIITLVSLGSIDPDGATAAAADRVATARQDAVVKTIESDNFQEQVEKFAAAHGGDMKAATEAIQLLRGLAKKDIKESQWAIRDDTMKALAAFGGPISEAFVALIASHAKTNRQDENQS